MPLKVPGLKRRSSIAVPKLESDSSTACASENTYTLDEAESSRKCCSDVEELECLEKLNTFCIETHRFLSKHLLTRYAVHYKFNFEKTKAAIIEGYTYSYLYLELEAELLRFIMKEKIFFPLPGLKSRRTRSDVLYMRPSRYEPSVLNNGLLLDNLCYVLNDMSRTLEQCRNGVVLIVNMDGYTMKNFHTETQLKMGRITEGQIVPTRIVEILIVNPPKVSHTEVLLVRFCVIFLTTIIQPVLFSVVEGCQTCFLVQL